MSVPELSGVRYWRDRNHFAGKCEGIWAVMGPRYSPFFILDIATLQQSYFNIITLQGANNKHVSCAYSNNAIADALLLIRLGKADFLLLVALKQPLMNLVWRINAGML
jgi:hypothetical protein